MPISHVSLPTGPSNFEEMRAFYLETLAPLGYVVFKEEPPKYCGLGKRTAGPDLWLHCGGDDLKRFDGNLEKRAAAPHIAFEMGSRRQVDEWYARALKAGGVSNGAPGERPEYVAGYYAAFVIDPLGNNIEAVYWKPWWLKLILSTPYVAAGLVGVGLAVAQARYYG
jgi:catechol 2,3-dioxygenase-like lactoylglutathione lyase family enzyme